MEHARLDVLPSAIRARLLEDHAAFVEGLAADAAMREHHLEDIVQNCSVITSDTDVSMFGTVCPQWRGT